MIVQAAPKEHLDWIIARAGCVLTPDARAIEVLDGKKRIRGMIAYDNWTPNAVQAHMVVENPIIWRHLIGPAFSYPFLQAGKRIILGIIPSHNKKSVAMTKRLGFRCIRTIRDGWSDGDDLIVFEMRRDECQWIPRKVA